MSDKFRELTQEQRDDLRRRRVFFAGINTLTDAFRGAIRFEGVGFDLPADAEVTNVWHDYLRDMWAVAIRSDNFEIVPEGGEAPRFGQIQCVVVPKEEAADSPKTWRDKKPML